MYNTRANETFRVQMDNLSCLNTLANPQIHNVSEEEPNFVESNRNKVPRPTQGKNAVDFTEDIKSLVQEDHKD